MTRQLLLSTLASLLVASCGGAATSVPVKGKDADVLMLAGKWVGEYEGYESRRQGSISFDLAPGYHTAEGQVIMHPTADTQTGIPLQIKFVQVGEGQINGKIAAYTDPGCNCQVETEFTGRVTPGSMVGTFVTKAVQSGQTQNGRWSAQKTGER